MNYRLQTRNQVDELHGEVSVYEHSRSGARVMTVQNSDKNKVFMIAFRTPPGDSTGVAHILEHSVLCGSGKYPLKDPFVELAKGSLNTFLNAMTYPDKTVYPIASVNDRDFMNLMDVYLDSVFYPRVYEEPKIFEQEGWHYEVEGLGTEDEEISLNGVVFNEMKGAFSNPDSVLERLSLNALFPDTVYAHESGGTPEDIPHLSYEEFLDFHSRYYHPSNSYIYLYGDMDMEEKLKWLDENYLSRFERIEVDSGITAQTPFESPREEVGFYALADNEDDRGKALLSENFAIPGDMDRTTATAIAVLDYILLSSSGAVLREALMKAGIGEDIGGGYVGELINPYFSVVARNTSVEKKELFESVIFDTLEDLAKKGINKKSLLAALNFIEFKTREEDFGSLPMGLAIGLNILSSWLYERDPLEFVYYEDVFDFLRKKIDTPYFEELVERVFLHNDFRALVGILPKKGLIGEKERKRKEELALFRKSLTPSEVRAIKEREEELHDYQNEPESEEALKSLPVLELKDIDPEPEPLCAVEKGDIIYSGADSGGIAYINVMFDTDGLSEEEIGLAAFLGDILGEVDTSDHSYRDLSDEVLLHTGGIGFKIMPYSKSDGGFTGLFMASMRVLDGGIRKGLGLVSEMIGRSVFDDTKRIGELISRTKTQHKIAIEGAFHKTAVTRAASYISECERYHDLEGGIAYYDFLSGASCLMKEKRHLTRFQRNLKAVALKLFAEKRLKFSLYGSEKAFLELNEAIPEFREKLFEDMSLLARGLESELRKSGLGKGEGMAIDSEKDIERIAALVPVSASPLRKLGHMNEGFKTGSEVNYDAAAGDFQAAGLCFHGGLNVLRVMLNYDYLWLNLRVLGGAYGCMAGFSRSGMGYLVSYRDPEVSKTYDVYERLPEYLENWDGDERDVRKYIIGAISAKDHPLTHSMKAAAELASFIAGITDADLRKERAEILSVTSSDIRGFAPYIRAILSAGARCTIGGPESVEKAEGLFRSVRGLF